MFDNLKLDEWSIVLFRLSKDSSLNMFSLSHELKVAYSHIISICKVLESKGFITMVKVGRKKIITVTPAGQDVSLIVKSLADKIGINLEVII